MPVKITTREYKTRLNSKFLGAISCLEKYSGSNSKILHKCNRCDSEYINSPFNMLSPSNKHGGCPKCSVAYTQRNMPKTKGNGEVSEVEIRRRITEKLGSIPYKISGKLGTKTTIVKFRCPKCRRCYSMPMPLVMGRKYICIDCVPLTSKRGKAIRARDLVLRNSDLVLYMYEDLSYTVQQISTVINVGYEFLVKVFKEQGWLKDCNARRAHQHTLTLAHSGLKLKDRQSYYTLCRSITNWVYSEYQSVLDPSGLRSKDYHLDHAYSRHKGFNRKLGPLPLTLLCHPANLKLISASDNLAKHKKSSLTLRELRGAVKEFNKHYGRVEFPEYYQSLSFEPSKKTSKSREGLTILGLDGGTKNFGFFVGEFVGVKTLSRVRIKETGMIKYPMSDFKGDFNKTWRLFTSELKRIIAKHKPDIVISERFQARGFKGTTIELVNMMNSAILLLAQGNNKKTFLSSVTAAVWKNQCNRVLDLKELYKLNKHIEPHRIDSCLLSMYLYPTVKKFEKDNVFKFLKTARGKELIRQLSTNTYN